MSVSASNLGLEGEEQTILDPTLSRYIQRTGSFKLLSLLIKFTGWLLLRKGKCHLVILQKCFIRREKYNILVSENNNHADKREDKGRRCRLGGDRID